MMKKRAVPKFLTIPFFPIMLAASVTGAGEPKTVPKAECATGCAVAETKKSQLGAAKIADCLEKMAKQPLGEPSLELETLLFHASEVIPQIRDKGAGPITSDQAKFLKTELARTHARIQLRVIDADGKQRMTFDRHVRLGEKQHLHTKAADGFAPPELGFTVKRVGLNHLWTRL